MSQEQWSKVDCYLTELLLDKDKALDAALRDSAAAGLPAISVSPNQGKLLHMLLKLCGARRVLEIGTLGGYSTIWLARGLARGGKLVTLESEARHAEVARKNLDRAGLSKVVEVKLAPAAETLKKMVREKARPFDFIFIDADKPSYPEYLKWSLKLAHPGTVIVADNIVRNGEIINEKSDDPRVQGARRFNELVAKNKRLEATAIQTVGSKGYDGFLVAVVQG